MEKQRRNNIAKHMVNLMYWIYNFNYDFIEECWKDEPHLAKHLREKFSGITSRAAVGYARPDCVTNFIMELTDDRKEQLFEYIIENYKGHKIVE